MKKGMIITLTGVFLVWMVTLVTPVSSQVIELTISNHNPPASSVSRSWDAWAKWMEGQSKGRLKLNLHHGGALLAEREAFRGTKTGVVDMAHYVVDRREGFHLSTVTTLPFLGMPGQLEAGELWLELYRTVPELAKEWDGLKIVGIFMMPPTHIHTRKKPIVTPADLKGLKMHGAEYSVVQTMHAAGASPVHLDITEMYTGLERGILDGVANHFSVLRIFKVLELTPFHTVFGDGGINMTPMFAIMNAKKFYSLPPDLQKLFIDGVKAWTDEIGKLSFPSLKAAVDFCVGRNHNIINLTPEQIKVWYDLVRGPIHEQWIKDAEARGLPGRAVYDETLRLIRKYKK